jgi:large subunit ribosomal protein L3
MAGQMGNNRVILKNLRVVRLFPDKNILLINGAIPGHNGSMVIIEK